MRIKICGITKLDQALAIAEQGATALGFICVPESPRYIQPEEIKGIIKGLNKQINKIGVWVNASQEEIIKIVSETNLTGVQLHGNESPEFCQELTEKLPEIEIIKAFRIKNIESLEKINKYSDFVNTFLLDAYHPQLFGGTGHTLDWENLRNFKFNQPWLLAGGLTPNNIQEALKKLNPNGIDLSSGVERSPGDKDLDKVKQLFNNLQSTIIRAC